MMIDESEQKPEPQQCSFLYSKWLKYIVFAIALLAYLFDRGPPLPPFPDSLHSFDCHYVEYLGLTTNQEFLQFHFAAPDSLEYPPEYLPNFLQARIRHEIGTFTFYGENALAFARSGGNLTLTYEFRIAGPAHYSLSCGQRSLGEFDHIMSFNASRSHHSTFLHPSGTIAEFQNVTFQTDTIEFSGRFSGISEGFSVRGSKSVGLNVTDSLLADHIERDSKRTKIAEGVLIAPLPPSSLQLGLHVLPFLCSLLNNLGITRPAFFTTGKSSDIDAFVARTMSREPFPVPIEPPSILITRLIIPDIVPHVRITDHTEMQRLLSQDFASYRRRFRMDMHLDPWHIAIPDEMPEVIAGRIAAFCPQCQVRRLASNFTKWRRELSTVSVLVSNHITSLLAGLLMNPGAVVIDTAPAGSYAKWAAGFCERNGLEYRSLHGGAEEECDSFACYPATPPAFAEEDTDALIELLRTVLNVPGKPEDSFL